MSARIQRAFTLIELLVTISIIGILATLFIANLNSARSRARDAQRKSDLRNIQTALRLYSNDKGGFPYDGVNATTHTGKIYGCGVNGISVCDWGTEFSAGSPTSIYMTTLPKDPLTSQSYKYTYYGKESFIIDACLENTSDASATTVNAATCPNLKAFRISVQ